MELTRARLVHVLVVDDDEVDRRSIERSFRKSRIANPIVEASNGVEALAILRGDDGREPLPRPNLVLLDLRMPRMSGLEFLQELRGDPELHDTVVFVLTTSPLEEDRSASYSHHVAGYIQKSNASEGFMNITEMLQGYWKLVELPQ